MSDLEVRRLTRELLRTGLDAEQILETVISELRNSPNPGRFVVVDHEKNRVYRTVPGRNPTEDDVQNVFIRLRLTHIPALADPLPPGDTGTHRYDASFMEHGTPNPGGENQGVGHVYTLPGERLPEPESMHGVGDEFGGSDY